MDIISIRRRIGLATVRLCVVFFLSACALDQTKPGYSASPAPSPVPSSTPDISAPGEVSGLAIADGDSQSILSWTRPNDADFLGVYIVIPSQFRFFSILNGAASCTIDGLDNGAEYDATVSTYDETGNLSAGIQIQLRPDTQPSIYSISPVAGTVTGGTSVTITGTGLLRTAGVTFGESPASAVTVVSDTTITCVTPIHVRGFTDVTTTKAVVSSTLRESFSFLDPAIVTIIWANLQFPFSMTATAGSPSALIFGRVMKAGVTGGASAPAGILAQAGYGPRDSDPRGNAAWIWIDAEFNLSSASDSEFLARLRAS